MQRSLCICPFLAQLPQKASTASDGDEDSLSATAGLLTAAALLVLFEEREIKVCKKLVRNIHLFSHTSPAGLTPKRNY